MVEDSRQAGTQEDLIQKVSDMLWDWEGGSELHGAFAARLIQTILASDAVEKDPHTENPVG